MSGKLRPAFGNRRRRAGVTLLELMVVTLVTAILMGAVTYAFIAGLDMERAYAARQAAQGQTLAMEQRITTLLQSAKLTDDEDDATTYFVAATTDTGSELGADTLTFTTTAPGIPVVVRDSEDDFETQQEARGPVGGVAEVSLSVTPVGDAGDNEGLFERLQRPSDGDPSQGGNERVLSDDVAAIGFQFWDGTQWTDTWDTTAGTERRLPAAVRVSYRLVDAPEDDIRAFVVSIPSSDVDAQSPLGTADTTL